MTTRNRLHPASPRRALALLAPVLASLCLSSSASAGQLAHWRFEQVQRLDGSLVDSVVGESLTGRDTTAVAPRPYTPDESGQRNHLQVWEPTAWPAPSASVFSGNVPSPKRDGKPNRRSLALENRDYFLGADKPLASADLRQSWTIEASLMTRRLDDAQVFICKDRTGGPEAADLAIGYDPAARGFYVEVKGGGGQLHRVGVDLKPAAGAWYDVLAAATYDAVLRRTTLRFAVKASASESFDSPRSLVFEGKALPQGTATWVVGRGYPIGQFVVDGGVDEVRIGGEALVPQPGENPLVRNVFTADPAPLVVGDTVYLYVGRDAAKGDEMFNMPEWLCYSSKDLKTWKAHGSILKPQDFKWSDQGPSAWASQMIEKDGKFYFYVTVRHDGTHPGDAIGVAVGDSPTGPFRDARGSALVTNEMTANAKGPWGDIDPTVFIDDDGTPWLSWGNGTPYLAKLKPNMIEFDGAIRTLDLPNFTEGPWLFKRGGLYYLAYAAQEPNIVPEQIAYATATDLKGAWTYRGILTGPAANSFTIHPGIIEFKGQWYLFYHNAALVIAGETGALGRRAVCLEYLYFNPDGTLRPVVQTSDGVSLPPLK